MKKVWDIELNVREANLIKNCLSYIIRNKIKIEKENIEKELLKVYKTFDEQTTRYTDYGW